MPEAGSQNREITEQIRFEALPKDDANHKWLALARRFSASTEL